LSHEDRPVMDLLIEKLVPGGEGLGFFEGKAVFVPGTIPGERIRAEIVESRKDYARGIVREILIPSPARQEPPCALAGECGGCDWLHIRYQEQLAQKKSIVRETLKRVGKLDVGELEIKPSPPLGYRNRIQVHRDPEGRLGFMGRRRAPPMELQSGSVIPVKTCPVASASVDRVFREPPAVQAKRFTAFGHEGLFAYEGSSGAEEIEVSVGGKRIAFSVRCFFQSNLAALEELVPFVVTGFSERATNGGAAADLYCGVGIFAAHAADLFSRIIAVESDQLSVSYARRNVPADGNEFVALTVERWIQEAGEAVFDAVIVDPPRVGLSQKAREFLLEKKPGRLVYVSCDPVTLARDLGSLVSGGFRLQEIKLFDFFPQTAHVESVAKLAPAY
jgi:23S rRNA (uracil1939-C5)-methyltransferase